MGQDQAYQQLWHVVDGAVRDAFRKHGDYLTPKGKRNAKNSVVKRVTGTVLSFAVQTATRQRELAVTDARHPAGDRPASVDATAEAGAGAATTPATHSHAHVEERCYQAIRMALFPRGSRRAIRKDARAYRSALKATTAALQAVVGPPNSPKAREAIRRAARGRAAL